MTVEQRNIIDFVTIGPSGDCVLTISDHLPWDSVNEHLLCLQEKLNDYLRFIESGEIKEKHPETVGCPIIVDVVLKYPMPAGAEWFFKKASARIEAVGCRLTTRQLDTN